MKICDYAYKDIVFNFSSPKNWQLGEPRLGIKLFKMAKEK